MGKFYTDQYKDMRTFAEQFHSIHIRCGYQRARETQLADDIGQDYLIYQYAEDEIAFCICDGVSLSYYGNLASKLLGDALIEFMWSLGEKAYESSSYLSELLCDYLQRLTVKATQQIRNHEIPVHIDGMLREVLEEKRNRGSESTFVCGKIKFSESGFQKVALAWMGDSRIRLWYNELELTSQLRGQFLTSDRWSTATGMIGQGPNVFISNDNDGILNRSNNRLSTINKMHIYTDGLKDFDAWTRSPNDHELTELIESCLKMPTSDDIAFFELEVIKNDISG